MKKIFVALFALAMMVPAKAQMTPEAVMGMTPDLPSTAALLNHWKEHNNPLREEAPDSDLVNEFLEKWRDAQQQIQAMQDNFDTLKSQFDAASLLAGNIVQPALDNMQKRVNSPDFELVVTAVVIQRQVGGNLAQILDTISDTINNRVRMRREIMTLTAQGRASGVVLALMPGGVGVIMSLVNPAYLRPLFEEPVGQACVAGAIVMEIIGYFVIQRIVNIKF